MTPLNLWRQLKITQKFIIAAVLIIISVAFVTVFFVASIVKRSVLEYTKISTADMVQRAAELHLSPDDFTRGATSEAYETFSNFSDMIRVPGVVRIKIWNRDARVLFSEDSSIVGKQFLDNAELLESFSGKIEAEIQTPQKAENISESGYRQLIEIYTPVFLGGRRELSGVIETYYSLDAVNALIAEIWWTLLIANAITAGFLIFAFWKLFQRLIQKPLEKTAEFASSFTADGNDGGTTGETDALAVESDDEIGEVNRAINQMLGRLRGFQRGLEEKVKERTADLSRKVKELRSAKNQIQKAQEDLKKFYEAVEGAAEHMIITDADGYLLYANKAAEDITGYLRKEMLGKRPSLWGGQMEKTFYEKMWKTIKTDKKTFHGEIGNKRKNGESYIADLRISPILDNRGNVKFFVGIERDITREREVDRLKNEFVSLASHQLQTPLTAIKWVTERLLKIEKNLSTRGKEYLGDIHLSGQRLSELVNRLLNVSRIEEGSIGIVPKDIDAVAYLRTFFAEVKPMCVAKNIQLVFEEHPETLSVKTDTLAFRNIVQSILGNAFDYTPRDGAITVSVAKKAKTFLVSIQDTGIGIPKAGQGKIFSKFGRAENAKRIKPSGSGIGLYIAKQAAELLGGRIWFESEEGKGSIFYVELPLVSESKTGAKQFI